MKKRTGNVLVGIIMILVLGGSIAANGQSVKVDDMSTLFNVDFFIANSKIMVDQETGDIAEDKTNIFFNRSEKTMNMVWGEDVFEFDVGLIENFTDDSGASIYVEFRFKSETDFNHQILFTPVGVAMEFSDGTHLTMTTTTYNF